MSLDKEISDAEIVEQEAPKYETRDPSAINNEYSSLCGRLGDLLLAKGRLEEAHYEASRSVSDQIYKFDNDMDVIKEKTKELALEMAKATEERAKK